MSMEQMLTLQLVLIVVVILALSLGFGFLGLLVHRSGQESKALGAATFLQGREMKKILREVREELARHT